MTAGALWRSDSAMLCCSRREPCPFCAQGTNVVTVVARAAASGVLVALGDGSDIEAAWVDGAWYLVFREAWGDCPSGCLYWALHYFIEREGEVERHRTLNQASPNSRQRSTRYAVHPRLSRSDRPASNAASVEVPCRGSIDAPGRARAERAACHQLYQCIGKEFSIGYCRPQPLYRLRRKTRRWMRDDDRLRFDASVLARAPGNLASSEFTERDGHHCGGVAADRTQQE